MPASSSSSTGTAEGAAEASTSSSAEPLLDVYGFRLPAEGLDQAGREASDKEQEEMTEKWSKYAKQRSLPSASKLKRYCRRVCRAIAHTLLEDPTFKAVLKLSAAGF